jgi:DNA-directed RNA polymerase specialized sigma24 family protein
MARSSSSAEDAGDDPPENADGVSPQRDASQSATGPESASDAGDEENGRGEEDERERIRRRLLAPIGRLYALAQTLTDSERAARRLVEATYARAAEALSARDAPPLGPPSSPDDDPSLPSPGDPDARAWLFALLVQTARAAPDGEAAPSGLRPTEDADADAATENAAADAADRHFRRRAQARFLKRALPPAFATLAPGRRLLLTLCDVEDLDTAAAARVADLSEDEVRHQHADARADLREALRRMAPRPERPFLEEEALPAERLRAALRRMAERDLTAPPPALRPAARHALQHRPDVPAAARGASEEARRPDRAPRSSDDADGPGERRSSAWRRRLPRLLVALLLIGGAGAVGYLATAVLEGSEATNIAALSAERAAEAGNLRLRTERPERAEQFVRDKLDRRLTVPRIEGAVLRGVGLAEVAPGERVPVFRFRDSASGRSITAYAYDYALLDRASGRLRLPRRLRKQITDQSRFARATVSDRRVLLWRHRDDIFAAVTPRSDSLQQRIAV